MLPCVSVLQEMKKIIHFNIYMNPWMIPSESITQGEYFAEKDCNKELHKIEPE